MNLNRNSLFTTDRSLYGWRLLPSRFSSSGKCISVKCDASTWVAPSKQALSRFQFKTQVKKPVSTVAEVSNCASICHSQDPHVESFKQIHDSIQKNRILFFLFSYHQGAMLVSLVHCFQTEIRHQLSDGLLFCTDIHEAQRMKPLISLLNTWLFIKAHQQWVKKINISTCLVLGSKC